MFQPRSLRSQRAAELASSLRILRTFVEVRWMRRWRTRAQLDRFQARRVQTHLQRLRTRSTYFAALIPAGKSVSLTDLPLMDKQVMMANFDAINTTGLSRDRAFAWAISQEKDRDFDGEIGGISVGLSSGTSGHRGLFITSKKEQEQWAGTVLARALPKGNLLGHRIALFLRADNNLYERAGSKAVSFKFFDIYADMDENLLALGHYQPTVLVAPPSVLHVIANQSLPTIQKVFSVAEVLERKDAQYLARAFNQDVIHQIYQCTEGFLAITCALGRIHLNEDVAIFEREYLTKDRFIPIVTDFIRTSQPIIRYRLNDVLIEDKAPCPCGSVFTVISHIEGREDDVLLFASKQDTSKDLVKVFADMVSRAMIYAEGFTHYRVVQTSNEHLDIYLDTPTLGAVESVTSELNQLLDGQGCGPRTYAFHHYHHQVGAKLRRIERSLPHA